MLSTLLIASLACKGPAGDHPPPGHHLPHHHRGADQGRQRGAVLHVRARQGVSTLDTGNVKLLT